MSGRRTAGRHRVVGHGGGAGGRDTPGYAEDVGLAMRDAFIRTLALIRKELLAVLKDPRSRITLFVPPILQSLVFGYAATYDLTQVPYAVVDQDRSAASRELLARLDGSGIFHRVADLTSPIMSRGPSTIGARVVIVQIGQDFERQLQAGRSANIGILADGRNSNTAGTASGYVGQVVERFNADWLIPGSLLQPFASRRARGITRTSRRGGR